MGKSLFEFANEKRNNDEERTEKENKGMSESELRNQVDHYSKFSQSQLLGELFSQVEKQKSKGEFNFEKIASQIEGIKPMLSEEQIKNINKLLNQIK